MIDVEAYLTFAEFNGGVRSTREEFRSELSRYSLAEVFSFCIIANIVIYGVEPDPNRVVHDQIVKHACLPETLPLKMAAALSKRALFHRQQLLFVAKESLIVCAGKGISFRPGRELTRLFLMANDQPRDSPPSGQTGEAETLRLLTEFIPIIEANRFFPFQHKFARPLLILNKILPTYEGSPPFDLRRLFVQFTGFEVDDYFGLLFCVLTKCLDFKLDNLLENPNSFGIDSGFLADSRFSRDEIDRFLKDISATEELYRDELQKLNRGPFDFTCFKNHPLLRRGDRVFPIDLYLLGARCESALYWKIYEGLSGKDRDRFQSFWGDVFQRYINWSLAESVDGELNRFIPSPKFVGTDDELCDGLILCGSKAVILEYKGGLFSANAKYDGAPEVLRADIEKKLVGTEEKRKGVRQLIQAIEDLFSASGREVAAVDSSRISKVYPVLVIHDDIGGAWFLNAYLNARFKALLNRRTSKFVNKAGSKVTVTPLFCISADHLEGISSCLRTTALSDILEARYRQEKPLNLPFLLVDNSSLGEEAFRFPELLHKETSEFVSKLKETFAPKK